MPPKDRLDQISDRIFRLIRRDPTLNRLPDVYDAQIMGSTPRQPGFVGGAEVHSVEVQIQTRARVLWALPLL